MKKVVFCVLLVGLLSLSFGIVTAKNWKATVFPVSTAVTVTAPYTSSSLFLQTQGLATANATIRNGNTIIPGAIDLYPLNFNKGEIVTLNASAANSILVIWYENNEK